MSDLIEERLRGAGLRATAPRVAVLRALSRSDDHPRVDQLIDRVRADGVSISTQAAYDVCDALEKKALASRLELPGGPVRYDARVGDNHHHLACRSCGEVVDVDCAEGVAPCLEPSDGRGFAIDTAEVTFWGTCPACQSSNTGANHE
ncbi:MAG: transcriptional repressor [Thermoleophilia bacterium]|nr:transcriptional repressor [Thermoleophilia bacterium]